MSDITIRSARAGDAAAVARLAALDSARVPSGDLIVAEVAGEVAAAYSPQAAVAIADPFRPTADVVDLLRIRGRAGQRPRRDRRRLMRSRLRLA